MNEGLGMETPKKSKLPLVIGGLVAVLILAIGGWLGYGQYTLSQDAKELRQTNAKLTKDIKAISDFQKVNDDAEVVALTKKADESTTKYNEYSEKNLIDLSYATLLNNYEVDIYNVEVAANELIQKYEANTSNVKIKNLFEDLKLASERRVNDSSTLKETSNSLLKFMKSEDTYHWNDSMASFNKYDDKYNATVDKYFDVKHELEKISKNTTAKVKSNQSKLDDINSQLWFK